MTSAAKVDAYATTVAEDSRESEAGGVPIRLETPMLNSATFAVGPILSGLPANEDANEVLPTTITERSNALDMPLESRAPRAETEDRIVTRACIASILGFVTLPIVAHAYSIWLLIGLNRQRISPKFGYRYTLAVGCNVLAFTFLFMWLALRFAK